MLRLTTILTLALAVLSAVFLWPHRGVNTEPAMRPNVIDIGFAQSMSLHHDQAVQMSQILLVDRDTELHGAAISMQTAQLLQIGQMRGWLTLWGAPLLPQREGMDWMLAGAAPPDTAVLAYVALCSSAPGGMPGLASSEDLNRLRAARGGERDVVFLQLMIRHHQGGLPMAAFAAQHASVDAVRSLAAQMTYHQDAEIQRMLQLLHARAAQPLP